MRQFLGCAVVPQLLEYGIRPALRSGRLFNGVTVTVLAVGGQRIAHVQIRVSYASLTEYFDAIIHAAAARPTVLNQRRGAVCEFKNAQRIVLGLGFETVDV